MNLRELQGLLKRLTYKSNMQITIEEYHITPAYPYTLMVRLFTNDSTGKEGDVTILCTKPLNKYDVISEQPFIRAIRLALINVEIHELDEWLKLDGEMVNDPHGLK